MTRRAIVVIESGYTDSNKSCWYLGNEFFYLELFE